MTRRVSIIGLCCTIGAVMLTAPLASGQIVTPDRSGFIAAQPEDLRPVEGATNVVILGDPSKPGPYVVRNTFAPGRGSRPHFHSQDRYVTVIKGTWWVALGADGDVYNPAKMVPMKAGSFILHPANGHHFDGARDEEVIVQIMGMGPVVTTQLMPAPGRGQGTATPPGRE